jgi:hypothetical protein
MVNEYITQTHLQIMYLGVSLGSFLCIMTNSYILICTNIVGCMCFIDLFFIKKKDMLIHHISVLGLINYLNKHSDVKIIEDLLPVALSTEISTIFLTLNNLLENNYIKKINKIVFVSTFIYYRIYNYSYYLIFNKDINDAFYNNSKNNFEYCQVYIGIYGIFILSLYWLSLIFKKIMYIDKSE